MQSGGAAGAAGQPASSQPLTGVRVLSLARYIAGPFCTTLLADFGAEVIEVEPPGGAPNRNAGYLHNGESLQWQVYHRNKKAISLNLRAEEGRDLLRALVPRVDVVVENYRPGTFEQMGFGYSALRALKSDVILLSISGFGQTGPLAHLPVFDAVGQAMSGLMSLNGAPDGDPVVLGPGFLADINAGTWSALALLLALMFRDRTSQGQHVDVSVFETLLPFLSTLIPDFLAGGVVPARMGNADRWGVPCNLYRTSDGAVYLDAGNTALFRRLCDRIGAPELATDARFVDDAVRLANVADLDAHIQAWTATRTTREVLSQLQDVVPVGAVRSVPEVAASAHLAARGYLVALDDSRLGGVKLPGPPIHLTGSPAEVRTAAPAPGADNASVYGDLLGLDSVRQAELRQAGII